MLNSNPAPAPTRTLTVVLSESDWRALRAAEPDALAWLQSQIRHRLATPPAAAPRVPSFASLDDDY